MPVNFKSIISGLITATLVTSSVVVAVLAYKAQTRQLPTGVQQSRWMPVENGDSLRERGNLIGSTSAAITLLEFGDFECPACAAFSSRLKSVMSRRPDDIALLYRHFPLRSHRFAEPAARAGECGAAAGKFAEMHDVLYEKQNSFGLTPWTELAHSAGITDTVWFKDCMVDPAIHAAVNADAAAAERAGAAGTPTLIVGGQRLTGVPTVDQLDSIIDAELAKKSRR